MEVNAIRSLYNRAEAYIDDGRVYIVKNGRAMPLSSTQKAAVDIEVQRLSALNTIKKHNHPLLEQISILDKRRIRPLAEGDTVFLADLNAQIATLRAQLQ